ncbi:hypothetical protein LGT39_11105 [Demequina sp. TTPB684]|uniref:hypothetical protein n=1 Tax=unclassified Demequina TaxID=2620311 RepID=UPI001CF46A72|nr:MULTISPECIES: hypothetical protein [unclassified Demequina]MCB2413392.1 hypothetical protein [Demequina sp. TTPB684]UPU87404.1 hypothetical protein LGT36_008995 [Demequina sp. TMPB413]
MKLRMRKATTLSLATASVAVLTLGFSTPSGGAASAPSLRADHEPTWWYQVQPAPVVEVDLEAVKALMEVKVDLRIQVRVADELYASSEGKATVETRRALAVERNRADAAVLLAQEPDEVEEVAALLAPALTAVTEEVAAWEAAEAARKAEEERLAREAAEAAAAKSARSSGGGSAARSGQTPQQYLDGVAAAFGTSISWASSACGHSGSWVSGCYTGGSTITVTTNAYSSWDRAKGEGRNVVIHEAAHYLTRWQCGTVYVGGDRFENVTDAYAILLGAGGTTGYGYNSSDMEWAKAIAAGRCEL